MKANQVRVIESPANPQFKTWKKCLEPQGIKKHGLFLLSGRKLVSEFLQSQPEKIEALITMQDLPKLSSADLPIYHLKKSLFKELDVLGTDQPLLLIQAPEIPTWRSDSPSKGIEVFLALQDPGNLGAALRLCEAFDVKKVVCLKESAYPLHPKSLKASAGSALRVPLESGPSIDDLADIEFFALDSKGVSITEVNWPKSFRVLLGEEGRGLPEKIKNTAKLLSVPMKNSLESLNATSALAITLYAQSLSSR